MNQEYRSKIEELGALNADLKNLINSTDVSTVFLDRTLAIRLFTPSVTGIFNFKTSDVGRRVSDVTHRLNYPEMIDDAMHVLEHLEKVQREVSTVDGGWFMVRVAPYRSLDDRIDGVVFTFTDTSARKVAEIEREKLLEQAQEASASKSSFLATLSHEFRTPLTAVIGYADLLMEGIPGELNDVQLRHLSRVKSAAGQLVGMVDEILGFTKLEAGATSFHFAEADPAVLAKEAIDMIRPQAMAKGLAVRMEISEELPMLHTDRVKLRQILINLLGNAIKFTDEGSVTLRVQPRDTHVIFEVEDTGIGISERDLGHVFDRFWQADPSLTRTHEGTGLGLTVVRQIARLLGGDVGAESELGEGSRFSIWLPVGAPAENAVR